MKNSNSGSGSSGLWTVLAIILLILLIKFSCTGGFDNIVNGDYDTPFGIVSCLGERSSGFGGGSSRGAGAGGRS